MGKTYLYAEQEEVEVKVRPCEHIFVGDSHQDTGSAVAKDGHRGRGSWCRDRRGALWPCRDERLAVIARHIHAVGILFLLLGHCEDLGGGGGRLNKGRR